MHAVLAAIVHTAISVIAAMYIAPYSLDPAATLDSMQGLCLASAIISAIGFMATTTYLSRRLRPVRGVLVGALSGLLCTGTVSLVMTGMDYSLIVYLAILAPTLLAVLLASLLDRPKSGWQT
jgi:Kef-type K+ transport system membrane component KefB